MREFINSLTRFFVSLRLTVVLLALSIVLVFVATIDQVHLGIWAVQQEYFRSFVAYWRIPVGDTVVESILRIVRAARPDADGLPELRNVVAWGPGPRASQAFMLACRARALIEGRLAPSTDDVVALAQPVLRHRMALNFAARAEGLTVPAVIDRLCRTLL